MYGIMIIHTYISSCIFEREDPIICLIENCPLPPNTPKKKLNLVVTHRDTNYMTVYSAVLFGRQNTFRAIHRSIQWFVRGHAHTYVPERS